VCQAGTKEIAFVVDEHLRLIFEASKSRRMDDPVTVALELAAMGRCAVGITATA